MQRLLSADPGHQGLETWLADTPQPRPRRDEWAQNPDFVRADAFYRRAQEKDADLMKVHFMGAEEVEEITGDFPLLQLIQNVNPAMDQSQLLHYTVRNQVVGNSNFDALSRLAAMTWNEPIPYKFPLQEQYQDRSANR